MIISYYVMLTIRGGVAGDIEAIAAIQIRCPEASQWDAIGYLQYDLLVAVEQNQLAGFLVSRQIDRNECEILNLAVSPQFRRRGVAQALVAHVVSRFHGSVYLEVRESNRAARELYKSMKFNEVSLRPGYYYEPPEAAIVMKFHSC